jgi:hypothetical protein
VTLDAHLAEALDTVEQLLLAVLIGDVLAAVVAALLPRRPALSLRTHGALSFAGKLDPKLPAPSFRARQQGLASCQLGFPKTRISMAILFWHCIVRDTRYQKGTKQP